MWVQQMSNEIGANQVFEGYELNEADSQIFRMFREFARQNPDFKHGLTDEIELNFVTTDRLQDPRIGAETLKIGYEFAAYRVRSAEQRMPIATSFILGLVIIRDNI